MNSLSTIVGLIALQIGVGCGSGTTVTTSSCSGVNMPSSLPSACASCLAVRCCDVARTCANSTECTRLTNCSFPCQSDDNACNQLCADTYPSAIEDFTRVSNCAQVNCQDTCAPGTGVTGGTGGTSGTATNIGNGTGGTFATAAGGSAMSAGGLSGIGGSSSSSVATCAINSQSCSDCLQVQCATENQTCQADSACKADFDTAKSCCCVAQKGQNAFGVQLCFDTFYASARASFITCIEQLCGSQCGVP